MTTTRNSKKKDSNASSVSNGYIQPVRLQSELMEQLDALAEHFTTSRGAIMRYTMQLGIRVLADLNSQIEKSVSSASRQLRHTPMPYIPSRISTSRAPRIASASKAKDEGGKSSSRKPVAKSSNAKPSSKRSKAS